MITVVIPYFQRAPGVLRKALASVAVQRDCGMHVQVIVVDDASPVPAAREIEAAGPLNLDIRVIARANGGPGAARNTALDNAPTGTRYIAFLDSDDEWAAEHVARAVTALTCGYDLFFGDHFQLGQTVGAFARAARLRLDDHAVIGSRDSKLHGYCGDMLDQIIRGNVIGTSTVVYDFQRFGDLRFRTEFSNAGEDYLFWMELVQRGARPAFSSAIEATYGKGINVYSGSGWGTEQFARRVHNEIKYRKTTLELFELNAGQVAFVGRSVKQLRRAFAADIVHRAIHRKPMPLELLRAHWALDPLSFAHLPHVVLGKLVGRR